MEEKKDKSDDPVVDLFPDDDSDDRTGMIYWVMRTLVAINYFTMFRC